MLAASQHMSPGKTAFFDAWHRIDSGVYLFRLINRLSVRTTYLLSTLLLSAVSAADYATGIELMMAPMYAFPCLLMDWRIGRLQALMYAIGASIVQWFVGTYGGRVYSHASYVYLDVVLNIVFYGALIWIVAKLRLALEMERVLSRVDFLTRLANRQALYEFMNQEIRRSRRFGHSLTLVTIDCRQFRRFCELRGHTAGDLLLQAVADALQSKFRSTDLISRSAYDEFMVVLPETDPSFTDSLLTSLHTELDNLMLIRGWKMSFSFALSVFPCPPENLTTVFERHAEVMRAAKQEQDHRIAQKSWEPDDNAFRASAFDQLTGQDPWPNQRSRF